MLTFIFKNRLLIGVLFGLPFFLFGLCTELAILHWDIAILSDNWIRIIAAIIISISLLPYVWMINDYFDAPYDRLDKVKGERNYFCSSNIQEKPYLAWILLLTPVLISLLFSIVIGVEAIVLVLTTLIIGHFYSAPPIRLKEKMFLDLISHGLYASGLFFLLGGIVLSPFSLVMHQPVFLVFLSISILDGIWIQFNSQLLDLEIDELGDQRTTSVLLGRQKSIVILRALIVSMLACTTFYLVANKSLRSYLTDSSYLFSVIFSFSLIILYLSQSYKLKGDFHAIRKHSAWMRRNFVYLFGILGVLLIK